MESPKIVRRALKQMDVGEMISFPVERTNTIRTTINSLKQDKLWNWTTEKIGRTLNVTRLADREEVR